MSDPNMPNPKWDPLYAPHLQVPAPPIPLHKDFAKTANGIMLGYDIRGHLATHLREIPQLEKLLKDIVSHKEIDFDAIEVGERIVIEQDMEREVGTTDQVRVTAADEVYYASRPNRAGIFTKFAKGRKPTPTTIVTGIVTKVDHPRYTATLHTGWTGPHAPPFPYPQLAIDNPRAFEKGVEFWSGDIALTDAHMEIVPNTQRLDCPWAAPALAYHATRAITLTNTTWNRLHQGSHY